MPYQSNVMPNYKTNENRIDALIDVPQKVVAVASDYPAGHRTEKHNHTRSQLVYAVRGVLTVNTEKGMWIVPPLRAVWVPANIMHQVEMSNGTAMRSLYIASDINKNLPKECAVVQVTPLLRELLLYFLTFSQPYDELGAEGRLVDVMVDQIITIPKEPLHLPATEEPRLNIILTTWRKDPANKRDLPSWAAHLNTSVRTLSRLFDKELGMSFSHCRQQIKLLTAIKKLAEGNSVSRVALDVGFLSQSSFIKLFRESFGVTPKQYFITKS